MARGDEITIELLKIYTIYSEQIKVSAQLSSLLHSVRDIKASGNEIEGAVRAVLTELLPIKYAVSQGHIIDKVLNVSKQYDVVIAENIDYSKLLKTADGTEIFLYENIYSIAEIKATWTLKNLKETIRSIKDLKTRLKRNEVNNRTIIAGQQPIEASEPLTKNKFRNPLFNIAFAIKSDKKLSALANEYSQRKNWFYLPNITVILNEGVFVLVNKKELNKGYNVIALYPEFQIEDDDFEWKFISIKEAGKNLAYLIFCLLEHLSSTLLEKPSYMSYSSSILNINDDQFFNLNEL